MRSKEEVLRIPESSPASIHGHTERSKGIGNKESRRGRRRKKEKKKEGEEEEEDGDEEEEEERRRRSVRKPILWRA
jgi:hypothetical protein